MSAKKDVFFRALSADLPDQDPEIQSCDGLFVDILWKNFVISMTDRDAFSVSGTQGSLAFAYFEHYIDVIAFINVNR